ncbi:bifunctional 3-oxoadipate enol-lactonase/4-carboxymuconolactone decarboxylase PcaDC [Kineococcus rubinsiae]|uniref:bifunctional 3-oxoadipate enol-lactonase/4-carboxymuconolactone decarboxylase PcaDC n=1 Tax=Kineococcus rubinsiae TaxID=2609562 RepID=UPI00142FACC1|nr:4-carboxymuconolactone decarboxylase [Kineococcus rubinsiae]NIZ93688.1 4-carboxymuconolactone decarboxylase [Kineococcus rubinsiae]
MSVLDDTRLGPPGGADLPLLVVGPSLGTTSRSLWSSVAERLGGAAVVVGWDLPGHGASAPAAGPLTASDLAGRIAGLGAAVQAERGRSGQPFAYAGGSLGGALGLQLALDHPAAVTAVGVVCSAARIGTAASWHERAATVRAQGMTPVVEATPARWFAPGFAAAHPGAAQPLLDDLAAADPESYAACCELLAGFDVRDALARIGVPVLAVGGAQDPVVPAADLLALGAAPGALATLVPGAAHQLPVEDPAALADLLRRHVLGAPAARRRTLGEQYAAGMAVRREVLGAEHVDRATLGRDDVTGDFQEMITRGAWGEVWTRPGLTRRERSMITLTALIARGHHEELVLHLRAAARNGLTQAEITEVLLQSAVYCGVPDANTAFRLYREVLAADAADD